MLKRHLCQFCNTDTESLSHFDTKILMENLIPTFFHSMGGLGIGKMDTFVMIANFVLLSFSEDPLNYWHLRGALTLITPKYFTAFSHQTGEVVSDAPAPRKFKRYTAVGLQKLKKVGSKLFQKVKKWKVTECQGSTKTLPVFKIIL